MRFLLGDDSVLQMFHLLPRLGDLLRELKAVATHNSECLSRIHAVVLRHSVCEGKQ